MELSPALTACFSEAEARIATLEEVGRAISRGSEGRLRAAIDAITAVLATVRAGEQAETEKMAQVQKAVAHATKEAATLLAEEAELSFDETRRLVSAALRSESPSGGYCYVRELYDDYVIYEHEASMDKPLPEGKLGCWKRSYTIGDGKVTFGEPKKVTQSTTWTEVAEGSYAESAAEEFAEVIVLEEGAIRKDGTIKLKLARPGWGSSGYYSATMLEKFGPKAFPKGVHMYWNHPTATEKVERPERDLRDLAATLVSDAKYDAKGPKGPGLYAEAQALPHYKEAIETLAPHIGVSLRAPGTARLGEAEGRKGVVVESFVGQAHSVDFVTKAGLGGEILQLFESARGGNFIKPDEPVITVEESDTMSEELKAQLEEANRRLAAQDVQLARLSEAELLRGARDIATNHLSGIDMPDITRARLISNIKPVLTEAGTLDVAKFTADLEEVAKAEVKYLTEVGAIGGVRTVTGGTFSEASKPEDISSSLEAGFRELGLSEAAVKTAAAGRTN